MPRSYCNHCGKLDLLTEVGKWVLCDDCKDLKQYQVKVKKTPVLKRTPIVSKRVPIKVKKGYTIPKISKKHAKKISTYSKICKKYKEKHSLCQAKMNGCTHHTTDVHHKMGKVGFADKWARENDVELLNDVRHFLPVCRSCHDYIESHPEFAYENNFSLRRNLKE